MTIYKVDVLETWRRVGWVHADNPEEAKRLVETDSPLLNWDEAEFLSNNYEANEGLLIYETVQGEEKRVI